MTERSSQPQNPSAGNEHPEVYSISQDKDGSFHFSRRDFLYVSAAVGGALLLRGVCPRFGANSAPGGPIQAGMAPLPRVPIHSEPSIASNIADTLQPNDLVRLISDRPDLGWVKVATQGGQQGWVKRSCVDFSRAIKSSSPNFDLNSTSTSTPTPTPTPPSLTFSAQLRGGNKAPKRASAAGQAQACGELILNGSFESGKVNWAEYTTGSIISLVAGTYHGDWAAWFGGNNAEERLTQLFHVPWDVEDAQTLTFYLYVLTTEPGTGVYDVFRMRFLNAAGNLFPETELLIADNNWPAGWYKWTIDLTGMRGVADQNIQLQFECINNSTNNTSFYLDLVSLNVTCSPPQVFVYLPLVVKQPPPTPTPTPCTSDCPGDCPSYCGTDCSTHCSSHCSSDCSSDCPSDCWSYCGSHCGWDCPSDCYSICSYDWSW